MTDSYPKASKAVKPLPVRLSLTLATVPQAYIPASSAAAVLGVSVATLTEWCVSGRIRAVHMSRRWWVTEGDLQAFVHGSTWQLVLPPD